MSDPEAARREWARRVTEAYDGWPEWLSPASDTSSGWSWGLTPAELEGVDRRLRLERRSGGTARAVRDERAYWGLEPEDG